MVSRSPLRFGILRVALFMSFLTLAARYQPILDPQGDLVLESSVDDFCFLRQMAPGYEFTRDNEYLLYELAVDFARENGWHYQTPSGRKRVNSGESLKLLARVARRAARGDVYFEKMLLQ
jgi:hypothetical protein